MHPTFAKSTGVTSPWWYPPPPRFIFHTHSGHENGQKRASQEDIDIASYIPWSCTTSIHSWKLFGYLRTTPSLTLSRHLFSLSEKKRSIKISPAYVLPFCVLVATNSLFKFYLSPFTGLLTTWTTLNKTLTKKVLESKLQYGGHSF